jgi:dihydrofolate reductase
LGKTILDITVSVDGFIAGANISPQQPLGEGGGRLHDWFFGAKTTVDETVMQEHMATTGAVILGGRTYKDASDDAWGGKTPFHVSAFVLINTLPEKTVEGFTFVSDGIEAALEKAQAAAEGKAVWLMGGAHVLQQYLRAKLVDEVQLHIAPMLLGSGTRLFDNDSLAAAELKITRVIETPAAAHIRYSVLK